MEIWRFIQDQILGMKWLNELIGAGHSTSGLDAGGGIGGSVRFFSLLCIENHSSALFSDFYHFLNTELLLYRAAFRRNAATGSWAGFMESGPISCLCCWGHGHRSAPVRLFRSLSALRVPDCRQA